MSTNHLGGRWPFVLAARQFTELYGHIRVGGIYGLERIARESEEDYWPITEILTAYVRKNAPRTPPRQQEAHQERTEDATDEQHAMEASGGKSDITERSTPDPDPDIQAIVAVLRRLTRYYEHGELTPRIDLAGTNLSGTLLMGAFLSGADVRGADLSEAYLMGADLSEAEDLTGAHIPGAFLSGADLSGARHLTQKQLESAKGNEYTQIPHGLKPPAHWGVKTDEQPEED